MQSSQKLSSLAPGIQLLTLLTIGGAIWAGGTNAATLGDSQVFTEVPTPPGYPEGIAVNDDRVYVIGPDSAEGNFQPSRVLAYDINSGTLVQEYPIQNQDFSRSHLLRSGTFNEKNFLYAVDTQQGIIRFDINKQGPEELYAPLLPDLPTCASVSSGTPCSPTAIDRLPIPNDITFDKNGYAYVSDTFQATLWRIPPGGGQPQIWFQDDQLDTNLGPNGIRINPEGDNLYFAVTSDSLNQGFIYSLPLVDQPAADDIKLFHQYVAGEGPDGIAFGESGKLYVALGLSNQISVLQPDGMEEARYSGPATDPSNPDQPLPWANPASIAFNNETRSLLVTNHAIFSPNAEQLSGVFDVFVDDVAASGVSVPVPEPSSVLGLLAFGALCAGSALKRKQKRKNQLSR